MAHYYGYRVSLVNIGEPTEVFQYKIHPVNNSRQDPMKTHNPISPEVEAHLTAEGDTGLVGGGSAVHVGSGLAVRVITGTLSHGHPWPHRDAI